MQSAMRMPPVIHFFLTALLAAGPPAFAGDPPTSPSMGSEPPGRNEASSMTFFLPNSTPEHLAEGLAACELPPTRRCGDVRVTLVGSLVGSVDAFAVCRRFWRRTIELSPHGSSSDASTDNAPVDCEGARAARYGFLVPDGVDAGAVQAILAPRSTELHRAENPTAIHGELAPGVDIHAVIDAMAGLGVVPRPPADPPDTEDWPPLATDHSSSDAERVAQRMVHAWERGLPDEPYPVERPEPLPVDATDCTSLGHLELCTPERSGPTDLEDRVRTHGEDLLLAVHRALGTDPTPVRLHLIPEDDLHALVPGVHAVSLRRGQIVMADTPPPDPKGRLLTRALAQSALREHTRLPRWLQDGLARYLERRGVDALLLGVLQLGAGEMSLSTPQESIGALLVAHAVRTRGPDWIRELVRCGRQPSCDPVAMVPFEPAAVLYVMDLYGRDAFFELDSRTCVGTTWSDPWEVHVPADGHWLLRCKTRDGRYLPADPQGLSKRLREQASRRGAAGEPPRPE